jgi:hypothetical protein
LLINLIVKCLLNINKYQNPTNLLFKNKPKLKLIIIMFKEDYVLIMQVKVFKLNSYRNLHTID